VTTPSPRDLTSVAPAAPAGPAATRHLSMAWRESAACRRADPELFFPIGSGGAAAAAEIQQAKAVCARCLVRRPCLAYALVTGQQYGIWGGLDENERRPLHRRYRETLITADEERSVRTGSS
jgi:WhiB family redox-sensing transcriptional regulator